MRQSKIGMGGLGWAGFRNGWAGILGEFSCLNLSMLWF